MRWYARAIWGRWWKAQARWYYQYYHPRFSQLPVWAAAAPKRLAHEYRCYPLRPVPCHARKPVGGLHAVDEPVACGHVQGRQDDAGWMMMTAWWRSRMLVW